MNVTLNKEVLKNMVECAIKNKRQIRIAYTDLDHNSTVRFVEPIRWAYVKDGDGVLTKCHERDGGYRLFRINGMDRIIITDYDFVWVNPLDKEERGA